MRKDSLVWFLWKDIGCWGKIWSVAMWSLNQMLSDADEAVWAVILHCEPYPPVRISPAFHDLRSWSSLRWMRRSTASSGGGLAWEDIWLTSYLVYTKCVYNCVYIYMYIWRYSMYIDTCIFSQDKCAYPQYQVLQKWDIHVCMFKSRYRGTLQSSTWSACK